MVIALACKDDYRKLCTTETSIWIYSRDWWMDLVCGENNWDVLLVEKGGIITAANPYYWVGTKERKSIVQPMFAKFNGIWINYPPNQKYVSKLNYEMEMMNEIIDEIEGSNIASYNQNFHYSITNWLPYFWRNFSQTTRYTYVIEDLSDLNTVYDGFESKLKRQIKKASNIVCVKEECDIDIFVEINKKTYERKGMDVPYDLSFIKRVEKVCSDRKCRKIFYAEDEKGQIHAAIYIVWDENSAYYIFGGIDPKFISSGAPSLLFWNAIQYAATVTKKFDFEGGIIKPIERFFRQFGAIQKPYFNISK